jgi:D-alanyl-D-alanine-carboxypeptidase/D-alanyl-D-alanine-endopeptidase
MDELMEIVGSLDEVLGPGAESLLVEARRRRLLNDVAVGIVRDGHCYLRVVGAEVGSRFQLGSLTKTYTAELLAILVGQGVVRLDDPVAMYVPVGRVDRSGSRPMTLLDLATHRAGLPRLPPWMNAGSSDPYADYGVKDLEKYLAGRTLQVPVGVKFLYSNLGYSLLGYALGRAAGVGYEALLEREILGPLGMTETSLAMAGRTERGLLKGHAQTGLPARAWTFDVCAPCGAICSTVGDQVKWMRWLLENPERESLQAKAEATGGEIGLGWMIRPGGASCWHNGATYGFSSWISLDKEKRFGVVVLSNRMSVRLVNALGTRFEGALRGVPVKPLQGNYGIAAGAVLDGVRIMTWPLRPFMRMPLWLRLPVVGGLLYAVSWLVGHLWAR